MRPINYIMLDWTMRLVSLCLYNGLCTQSVVMWATSCFFFLRAFAFFLFYGKTSKIIMSIYVKHVTCLAHSILSQNFTPFIPYSINVWIDSIYIDSITRNHSFESTINRQNQPRNLILVMQFLNFTTLARKLNFKIQ